MLNIIKCEFGKLKRRKFLLLVVLSAFLFPVPLTVLMTRSLTSGEYDSKAEIFNEYFQFVMGYGIELLLPCVIGVFAAMLFFMERDSGTSKNLRAIPVTSTQMVLTKITVLFICGAVFSLTSALVSILCGEITAQVSGIPYRLLFAVEMGIFITAGTLPLIVLVVFFSRNYVFSVLMCVFYSVLSTIAESSFGALPKLLCWLMPIPLTTLWAAGDLTDHGFLNGASALEYLIPSTAQTAAILAATALISTILIDYMYKKRRNE